MFSYVVRLRVLHR